MAAGSEVPTHGPLNIGYGFSPSVYQPQAIAVPQGAGALWAGVGKTALDAGAAIQSAAQALQQSPVNPMVKQQQLEAKDRAQMGQKITDYAKAHPGFLRALGSEGPGGASLAAPATLPVNAVTQWGLDEDESSPPPEVKKEEPKDEPKKDEPKTDEPKTEPTHQEEMGQSTPAANLQSALASLRVPSQGGSSAAMSAGGDGQLNTGQPQDPGIQATPAPQPSGSIWSPGRPAPLAPPAPGPAPAPAQQPAPAQSQTPAAATQADQASMAQWRAQNEHPVMSSQDALGWMKNFDTGVKRATYLPMGGPGGSPAFAFHMDGGGINTVPVSQMAQKGGGPLIASQNTSQVISSTDQAQQGGPGAQGQPPAPQDQTQVPPQTPPNISPPPPANLPPAAPTGQPQMQPTGQVSPGPTGTSAQPWGPPPAPTGPAPVGAPNMLTDAAPYLRTASGSCYLALISSRASPCRDPNRAAPAALNRAEI